MKVLMKKSSIFNEKSIEIASLLKTLAHPQRLLLLCFLLDGAKSVNDISEFINISQSQTSQFLNRMSREGLLGHSKKGNFIYYKIKDNRLVKLIKSFQKIYC